jgi:hypothetical protein
MQPRLVGDGAIDVAEGVFARSEFGHLFDGS